MSEQPSVPLNFDDIRDKDRQITTLTARIEQAVEAEQVRWQERLDKIVRSVDPKGEIDGGGCDSGDPLDLTEAEMCQAFDFLSEQLAAKDKRIAELKELADPVKLAALEIAKTAISPREYDLQPTPAAEKPDDGPSWMLGAVP